MARRFDLLIFDLDATLIDGRPGIRASFNHALKAHGHKELDASEIDKLMKYSPVAEMFKHALPGVDNPELNGLVKTYTEHYAKFGHEGTVLLAGVPEVLVELRRLGFKLAVATSKADKNVVPLLDKIGILKYFDAVTGEKEGMAPKPGADVALYLMKMLAVPASRTVMIGDSSIDVETARNAKIECIGVLTGAELGVTSLEKLRDAHPVIIIRSLYELPQQVVSKEKIPST